MIKNEKKQSLFCLTADVENNYSFNKLDIKNDEFEVKCLIENVDLNKDKLQIDLSYHVNHSFFKISFLINYYSN